MPNHWLHAAPMTHYFDNRCTLWGTGCTSVFILLASVQTNPRTAARLYNPKAKVAHQQHLILLQYTHNTYSE